MSAVLVLESSTSPGNRKTSEIVRELLAGTSHEVVAVSSVPEARRRLISEPPAVVLLALDVVQDALNFTSGLRDHPSLCEIPVVLCADGQDISLAVSAKTAGVAAISKSESVSLREVLAGYLPELRDLDEAPVQAADVAAAPSVAAPVAAQKVVNNVVQVTEQVTVQLPEGTSGRDQHFQAAQKLLAQVLHNLKTSNLLDVASAEDVPRIVSEITRKVCDGVMRARDKGPDKGAGKDASESVDLGAAFSKKQ